MRIHILILLVLCGCAASTGTPESDDSYTLYLVRHAEKQADGSKDPALTGMGRHRSELLSRWFLDKTVTDIWSSDYKRTRETAGPLLSSLDLSVMLYDPRNLPELAEKLQTRRNNAVVVGHSNTTPQLARLICTCEIPDMDESEYDRLIAITVTNGKTSVESLSQKTLFQP